MGAFRETPLRALAPASLVVFAIVFLIVVIASLSGGDDSSSSRSEPLTITEPRDRAAERARARERRERRLARRGVYIVRPGDSLVIISEKTGVPIETLTSLNPTVDPQALVTGQRIRLPSSGERGATGASGATGTTGQN
jgi:LysM domain